MDTLTHALSGALLARALTPSIARTGAGPAGPAPAASPVFGPRIPVWQALTVGLLAGAFPDSDVVLKFVSDLAYLRGHRGVTHSIVMLPVWSALLGGLFAAMFRHRAGFRRYAWLSAAAIAIHIAGDWITQFGTMLLAPLSDHRFGLGSVFIIDLVFSGIVVAGLLASALFFRSRAPALAALALLPLWVGVTLVGKSEAIAFARDYAQKSGIAAQEVDAAPRPGSPFNWSVFVFDGQTYRVAHVNTRRVEPLRAMPQDSFLRRFSAPYQPLRLAVWETVPRFGADNEAALAREVWAQPGFAFFRWFALFPAVYRVENGGAEHCVWFRDLRFAFPGRGTVPFRFGMCRPNGGVWSPFALDDIAGRAALR